MGDNFHYTYSEDGTPLQASLLANSKDYKSSNLSRMMLGVVLKVYPSDDPQNLTAQQTEDRHGFIHECDVLVIDDGSDTFMTLKRVVITPDSASGVSDYSEKLPRGCSKLVSGEEYDAQLYQIDPYELDGDWCVVGFIGGWITSPFIVRYWPHAKNTFDPATSGQGAKGDTLEQSNRYFRRVNGVEYVVSAYGDITLSTHFANSKLAPGQPPKFGRMPYDLSPDVGGSIKVAMKPSQIIELDFNEYEDGIGLQSAPDPDLPQKNPPEQSAQSSSSRINSVVVLTKESARLTVPEMVNINTDTIEAKTESFYSVESEGTISVFSKGTLDIVSEDVLTLEGSQIMHGENATTNEPIIKGQSLQDWMLGLTVDSPFGPLPATATYVNTLVAQTGSTKNYVE